MSEFIFYTPDDYQNWEELVRVVGNRIAAKQEVCEDMARRLAAANRPIITYLGDRLKIQVTASQPEIRHRRAWQEFTSGQALTSEDPWNLVQCLNAQTNVFSRAVDLVNRQLPHGSHGAPRPDDFFFTGLAKPNDYMRWLLDLRRIGEQAGYITGIVANSLPITVLRPTSVAPHNLN